MIKLKSIIENIISPENTFQMYHGGTKWYNLPEIRPAKKDRYEGGIGIYFTTNYLTARNYAKGGKVIHLTDIDRNFKDIEEVDIELNDMMNFLRLLRGLKNRSKIERDIIDYSNRVHRDMIPAEVLNNLIVNHEAGSGRVGLEIVKYFISKGIDASVDHQSGEDWLVVFNPKVIKRDTIVDSSKLNVDKYNLPKISR